MPDTATSNARFCSQCGQAVTVADATFCKECGAPLAGALWLRHEITWRPIVAFALSFVPGLGQFYKQQRVRAVLWFLCVLYAYQMAPPLGLLLHLICAGNAAFAGAIREGAIARTARGFASSTSPVTARPPR